MVGKINSLSTINNIGCLDHSGNHARKFHKGASNSVVRPSPEELVDSEPEELVESVELSPLFAEFAVTCFRIISLSLSMKP